MSHKNPRGAYIYQPYGGLENPEQGDNLFGISGVVHLDIRGITKGDAERLEMMFNHPEFVANMLEIFNILRNETINGKWIRQTTRNKIHEFYEKQLEE